MDSNDTINSVQWSFISVGVVLLVVLLLAILFHPETASLVLNATGVRSFKGHSHFWLTALSMVTKVGLQIGRNEFDRVSTISMGCSAALVGVAYLRTSRCCRDRPSTTAAVQPVPATPKQTRTRRDRNDYLYSATKSTSSTSRSSFSSTSYR